MDQINGLESQILQRITVLETKLDEFISNIKKSEPRIQKLELDVANLNFIIKGIGGVLIGMLVAITPVAFDHYISNENTAESK